MKKISTLSNIMIGIFSLYLIWLPISFGLTWYFIGFPPTVPSSVKFIFSSDQLPHSTLTITNLSLCPDKINPEDALKYLTNIPVRWKTLAGFIGMIGLGLAMWMTFKIIDLFRRYSKKQIFDLSTVKLIHKISLIFFSMQIFYIFGSTFGTFLYTIATEPVFALSFGTHEMAALVLGVIVLVASKIMYEVHKMRDDILYTI